MTALVDLQQSTRTVNHRLLRIDPRGSGDHRVYFTAVCTCGWKTIAQLRQHYAERALEIHAECQTAKEEREDRRSDLLSQWEELLVVVVECERAWREEDRIDTAVRYSR